MSVPPDLAAAALAVLRPGEARISMPELLGRLRLEYQDLRAEALGAALTAAGWHPMQWRTAGRRVRGYQPPNTLSGSRTAINGNGSRPLSAPAMNEQDGPAMSGNLPAGARDVPEAKDRAPGVLLGSTARNLAPAAFRSTGAVGPGPHAVPPAGACAVCGGTRWWRATGRSDGWRCFCTGRPTPSDQIIVVGEI